MKKKLIKDGISSFVINSLNKLLVLIGSIILVRILGKEQYGIYSYIFSIVSVLILPTQFGITNLVVRETAQAVEKENDESVAGIWTWSLRLISIFSLSLILISVISTFFLPTWFSKDEVKTFLFAILLIPLLAFMHLFNAGLKGLKEVVLGQISDLLLAPLLFTLAIIIVQYLTPIELSAKLSMALKSGATLFAFIMSLFFFFRKAPSVYFSVKPIIQAKKWLISSLILSLSSGLNMVKFHVNVIVMGFFVPASEIGIFQVAANVSALAIVGLNIINTILAPQFASLHARGDEEKLQYLIKLSARIVLSFNLFVSITFMLFGKRLLVIVFGTEFIDAYSTLLIILIGQFSTSFFGSVAFLLNMTGYEKYVMKVIMITTLANILTTFLLTPVLGINGAAFSISASQFFGQFYMYKIVRKKLGINSLAI